MFVHSADPVTGDFTMHRVSWLLAIAILICITALVAQAQDGRNSVLLQPATPNSPALQEVLPPPPPSQPPIVIPTDNPDDLDRESDWRFHEIERRIKKAEERMERDLAESAKLRRDAFEKNDEKLSSDVALCVGGAGCSFGPVTQGDLPRARAL